MDRQCRRLIRFPSPKGEAERFARSLFIEGRDGGIMSGDLGHTAQSAKQLRRAIVAATIGTTIEWYDFFLYSTVTGLVFGKLYFPESEPLVGTLQAFAVYAV